MNPRTKLVSKESFSICHWNLNNITLHTKIFLLKAYVAACLSEIYLDSKTLPDDYNLDISRYNLVRSHHPPNSKRGGVCIYYKEALLVRVINVNFLNEGIRFELKIDEKLCNFISLCRSPSQTQDEFDKFTENLELNLDLAVQSLSCCGSCCIFADDTSLFSVTHNINTSTNELNNDLAKIDSWAFQ